MKSIGDKKGVILPVIASILICISITFYVIKVGEPWTEILMDAPLFYLQSGQIGSAIVIGIILACIKKTRKNGLWLAIPLIIVVFALSYDPILRIVYPCC